MRQFRPLYNPSVICILLKETQQCPGYVSANISILIWLNGLRDHADKLNLISCLFHLLNSFYEERTTRLLYKGFGVLYIFLNLVGNTIKDDWAEPTSYVIIICILNKYFTYNIIIILTSASCYGFREHNCLWDQRSSMLAGSSS